MSAERQEPRGRAEGRTSRPAVAGLALGALAVPVAAGGVGLSMPPGWLIFMFSAGALMGLGAVAVGLLALTKIRHSRDAFRGTDLAVGGLCLAATGGFGARGRVRTPG